MDYIRIIVMAWLEHLSGVFERIKKKIVKNKDLTPEKVRQEGILRGGRMKGGEKQQGVDVPRWSLSMRTWFVGWTLAALIAAIKDVDKLRIIVMALLGRLSGVFERIKKKIVKGKDLTPQKAAASRYSAFASVQVALDSAANTT